LTDYAKKPPPESFLIVRAPTLDLRRKLHKALAKSGKLLVFEAASPTDTRRLLADVKAMASEKGVTLANPAATFLAEVCAGDLHRLASELGKIAAWRGDAGGTVDLASVQGIASGSGLLSGWEVADAVLLRDRPAALSAARRLVESGDVPIRIVGGLAFRARSMLQAKAMLDSGANFRQVVQAARAWPYQDKLQEGLARYTLAELLRFPALLLEADRTLKSRSISPGAVIEALIDRMTQPQEGTQVETQ
jgi:DNA polymerase-3 subunit delta